MKKISKWLYALNTPQKVKNRFIVFPFSGGSVIIYRHWLEHIGENDQIIGVELPGRGFKISEEPISCLSQLVEEISHDLKAFNDVPMFLFGHSFGAMLAFETAYSLSSKNSIRIQHLFVSAFRAPNLPNQNKNISHLSDEEFLKGVSEYDGMPREILENKELIDLFLPALKTDFSIHENHVVIDKRIIDFPITGFFGTNDKVVKKEHMLGWVEFTNSKFQLHKIVGDHFYIKTSDSLIELLMSFMS